MKGGAYEYAPTALATDESRESSFPRERLGRAIAMRENERSAAGWLSAMLSVLDGLPDALWRRGHVEVCDAEVAHGVDDCVPDGGGGCDCPRLADALGSEWVAWRG